MTIYSDFSEKNLVKSGDNWGAIKLYQLRETEEGQHLGKKGPTQQITNLTKLNLTISNMT